MFFQFSAAIMKRIRLVIPMILFLWTGLITSDFNPDGYEYTGDSILTVTVDVSSENQVIRGFGASDAWSTQFVGKNWPIEKREQIADLLFSRSLDSDGNPKGIGLSIWRFNIGAGSAVQGEDSGIRDEWRRADGFLQDDLTYDWSRQSGQRWFLHAAKERGVETFIGFSNSPPVQLTRNGRAFGDGGSKANLAGEKYADFARFLGDVVIRFKEEGIRFHSISPVNEPQWDWSEGNNQEGSPWQNHEIAGLVKVIDEHFTKQQITTKIEIPEAAQINFLYDEGPANRGYQLDYFWGDPETRISDLQTLSNSVAAHSYYTTWPVSELIRTRKALRDQLDSMESPPELWMSEYCILENNEEVRGPGRDTGMDPALYMSRVIHYELTIAGASSWQWWLGVSPYDYNDGLVYIDHDKYDGEIIGSRKLWVMGNFSRFIRPDAVRLDVEINDGLEEEERANQVMISAYRNEDGSVAIVAVNYSDSDRDLLIEPAQMETDFSGLAVYTTSDHHSLEKSDIESFDEPVLIPARSVVTVVAGY
jgi:O-glycosyl hydrolase